MGSIHWKKKIVSRLRLLLAAFKKFDGDHGFFLSSGITFNLLIGLIPLSLLLLALVGTYLYSDQEVLSHIRRYLEEAVPSLDPRIRKGILRVTQDRKIVGVLGIGGILWTATCVFSSLRTALNMVFHVEKGQGILKGKAVDLFMIFLAGLFHLASMGLTSGITYIECAPPDSFLDMGSITEALLKYIIPFLFTFWMFFLIYKVVPNRKIHFHSAFWAASFASLLWEITKQLFGWYVLNLGKFSLVYGYLSTLVIFVLWVYYSSAILLVGGEVAFLLERAKGRIHG